MRSTGIIFVGDLFNASIEVLSVVLIASFATPFAIIFGIPLFLFFFWVQKFRAKHLDRARSESAVATSFVMSRQTDLIEGRSVFLLYGKTDRLLHRMRGSLDGYLRTSMNVNRIELLSTFLMRFSAEVFSVIVLFYLVFALKNETISVAFAGVIVSSLIGINGSIGWLDFAVGLVTRSAPHVRRVFEYFDLPNEESEEGAPFRTSAIHRNLSPGTSPERNQEIEFKNLSVSYRSDTPVILSGLNLTIRLGEKIALVGRTGSGKTSLMQALLRMVYVHEGEIRIGGESIYSLSPVEVRRKFGVVPQFPYLFEGTIRSSLDRNFENSDQELNEVLRQVGVTSKLTDVVNEGGKNYSLGERQLLCLARVLLAKREIILMDEPTSGLDPVTDARLSALLRTAFQRHTVITIAHRKESLLNYDRVIEMSFGKVIWQGKPSDWLQRKG